MKKPLFTLLFLFFILSGCTETLIVDSQTPTINYCTSSGFSTAPEIADCSNTTTYSSPSTVSGTATFFKRGLNITTIAAGTIVFNMELGPPISTPLPIKYAEVRVLNSAGTVVQCGKTDANGNIRALNGTSSLQIPSVTDTYTVQVMARSNHDVTVTAPKPAFKFYAAVKSPCNNDVHKISSSVSVTNTPGTVYSVNPTAFARESQSANIEGAAFNIYNNLAATYDYLAQNTASDTNLACLNPKLSVYWSPGFNPAQLIYPSEDPATLGNISFYLRGYDELYINGGKLGNVSSADTDHFDDAVIIHEIGHRIEDACGKMDSPGGTHFGQFRIDPRLAWSEGWGNFFGAHIIRNNLSTINPGVSATLAASGGWSYYLDTSGYTDGAVTSGQELIRFNLSRLGANAESAGTAGFFFDRVDSTNFPGEGHFREVSVARGLFKNTNTCTNCVNANYFAEIWKAFEKDPAGVGMGKSIYPFRNSARFYDRLKTVFSGTLPAGVSNTINVDEAQQPPDSPRYVVGGFTMWPPYGIRLVNNGSTPCSLKIQPRQEDVTVTNEEHDQRYSSHFYYYDRSALASVSSVTLTATKTVGTDVDIDLVLYQDGYSFPTDCLTSSCTKNTTSTEFIRANRSVASNLAGPYTKQITGMNTLSSAPHLLNVRAFTSNKTISSTTEYTYTLTDQAGNFLCPDTSY